MLLSDCCAAHASSSVEVRTEDYEQYYKKQRADSNCGFAEEFEVRRPLSFFYDPLSYTSDQQVPALQNSQIQMDWNTCSNNDPDLQAWAGGVVHARSLPHSVQYLSVWHGCRN